MKYTIILEDNDRQAEASIETRRPLVGNEPVIATRLKSLEELIDGDQNVYKIAQTLKERWTGGNHATTENNNG